MSYISSVVLIICYIYVLKKFPYVRCAKPFLVLFSLFVFRLILSFNHQISFKPLVVGQSLNSLFSILSVAILLLVVSRSFARFKGAIPLYLLISSALASGFYSGLIVGGAIVAMKWLLMFLIISCLLDLFRQFGLEAVVKPFSYVFLGLLFSQFLSLVLRQGKDTESIVSESNAVSYIAGYAHEGAFSVLLFMGLLISSILLLVKKEKPLLPFVFFVALIFANYRTTVLSAVIPVLFIYFAAYYVGAKRDFKIFVMTGIGGGAVLLTLVMGESIVSRFGEIGTALSGIGELMSIDYSVFTREEKRLLSSRLYLWNMYITEYNQLGFLGKIFGAGPESWPKYFVVYAHNNFVGSLFDLGLFGLISLLLLFWSTFVSMLKICDFRVKVTLLGLLAGFFIMSNSTMPFWAIEGIYTYSFLFAIALWYSRKKINV